MFSKFIKKSQPPAPPIPEAPAVVEPDWESRLEAASGNDQELLALAAVAQSMEQKLACVQALQGEEGLRAAERQFRKHDRRVHSLAKQRHEALVKQRETRAAAAELIQTATVLQEATMIPANRLAEINHAWEQLDTALLEEQDRVRFSSLQANLAELIRERGERKRAIGRWSASASQALAELCTAGACVSADSIGLQELHAMFEAASAKARATLAALHQTDTQPLSEDSAVAALLLAIRSALQDSAIICARIEILEELQSRQPAPVQEHVPIVSAVERWQALPAIADPHIESVLKARLDEFLHQQEQAHKKLQKQNSLNASKKDKAVLQVQMQELSGVAEAAEAALAAGNLAEAAKLLAILQATSAKGGLSPALQTRIGALQSDFTRLKGWQHWGGGLVRDELVLEAEALAASTLAPRQTKLPIKQIETSIEQMRARWKDLDRLGGATNKPLWQRFDAALKTAYLPVAAHLSQLNEARLENLATRKNLLNVLDALNIEGQGLPDWKEISRALSHFQTEWRKLGPLEHTAPHKSQAALLERMKVSVARLEQPLKEVQLGAQAEREQFIVRARALGQDMQSRDTMAKLRELQSQWQAHAKAQPLPRKVENQLWGEFKAAADELMSRREAAMDARDAGFKANQEVREALIARLDALHADTPPADIKRLLASVESEWLKAGEAPRNQAARLESGYRAAREKAQHYVAGSAQRSWQLVCAALQNKLALCAELETAATPEGLEARWQAQPVLPAAWEQALQRRFTAGGTKGGEALDQLLLQLESLLEIPTPEAYQMARRALKFLAMKTAMEGRQQAGPVWPEIEKITAAAIGCSAPSDQQSARLNSIIGALSRSGAGKF